MENPTYNEIISKLENELTLLKSKTPNIILLTESAMILCKSVIKEIRHEVIKNGFSSKEEEIFFFKNIKPKVNSKLIFYVRLFEIETHRKDSSKTNQIVCFEKESKKIQRYFKENLEFCQYYWRQQNYLDHLYFVRGNTNIRIHPDNIVNFVDPEFSTAYDQTVANILAFEQLAKYLENELLKLRYGKSNPNFEDLDFLSLAHWDGTDTEMVELVYALVSAGVINKGNITLKELLGLFERVFNREVNGLYQVFSEIKKRKKNRTIFLNRLIDKLIERMDKLDEL